MPVDYILPLKYFAVLVNCNDELPLFEAACSIAQDEYTELDIKKLLGARDAMLLQLRNHCKPEMSMFQRLRVLNWFFYRELGFGGNVGVAYHPKHVYLNSVLETRRGDALSLGVLWIELARGVGLTVEGVMVPGAEYFVVRVRLPREFVVLLDPLSGRSIDWIELEVMERLQPYEGCWDAETPIGQHLRAATTREILGYMLRELKKIYQSTNDDVRHNTVVERLKVLEPGVWDERGDCREFTRRVTP